MMMVVGERWADDARNLMAPDEFKNLGFATEEKGAGPASPAKIEGKGKGKDGR
jgi:hypothetical protein